MYAWLPSLFGGGAQQVLTREAIDTLPAGKLCRRVLRSFPDAELANGAQRDFVYMLMLDGEVNNGGFNQYYYNVGEDREKAVAAFAGAGAAEAAELVRQANECYESNREKLKKRWDGTMKGFSASYKEHLFDRFDEAYFALMKKDRFNELLAAFVRSCPEEFVSEK